MAQDLVSARDGLGCWRRFVGTVESRLRPVARVGGLGNGLLVEALYFTGLILGIIVPVLELGSSEFPSGGCSSPTDVPVVRSPAGVSLLDSGAVAVVGQQSISSISGLVVFGG